MRTSSLIAATALAATAAAAENYLGFNSGAMKTDDSAKFEADFKAEFTAAQGLKGAPGTFNAVRLYTNIQAYSKTDPIEAFQAAIDTDTKILLGIWTSQTNSIQNELTAIGNAVTKFGSKFTDLVIGISIGSEDLYRNSVTGVTNDAGVGADPDVIVKFISDYKKAVADTPLKSVPIGHVDTWDVWGNSSNKAVLDAVDWVGVDEYPYYENGKNNTIENAGYLFDRAFDAVVGAVGGKPIWVTETGWPLSGPTWDLAVPSVKNAKFFWDEVGCRQLFNKVPTFWYNLRDSNGANKQSFAITKDLSTKPSFDLSCPKTFVTQPGGNAGGNSDSDSDNSSSAIASPTKSGSNPQSTGSSGSGDSDSESSGSGSGSGNSGSQVTTSGSPSGTASGSNTNPTGAAAITMPHGVYAGAALIAGAIALL